MTTPKRRTTANYVTPNLRVRNPAKYKLNGTYTRKGNVVTFSPAPEPAFTVPMLRSLPFPCLPRYEEGEFARGRYTMIGDTIELIYVNDESRLGHLVGTAIIKKINRRWRTYSVGCSVGARTSRRFCRWMNKRKPAKECKP